MGWLTGSASSGFEQYARQVYGWAYRLLGRHHDALDVVQDVFVRWDRQCAIAPPVRPAGWLRRVTVNRAIDMRRRDRDVDCDGQWSATAPSDRPVVEAMDVPALRHDVGVALDELSEMQRSVLIAKVYDDLTFAQVAEELDISVSAAKTHYLRAVRVVRDRLGPRWGEEDKR